VALYNVHTKDVRSSPSTSEVRIDLQHRGLGYKYQRLTNSLVGASGAHVTWPPSITKHQCAMSEVSLWVDDRGLVGTQVPQSRSVTGFSEETK